MLSFSVDKRLPMMISTVTNEVLTILRSEQFYEALISFRETFPQSNLDGPTLYAEIDKVLCQKRTVKIIPYVYPFYKFPMNSKVVAHVPNGSTSIYLTKAMLTKRNDAQYCTTIAHEFVHVVDNLSPYYFGHGDNDPRGDERSASHVVAGIVTGIYIRRSNKKYLWQTKSLSSLTWWYEQELGAAFINPSAVRPPYLRGYDESETNQFNDSY